VDMNFAGYVSKIGKNMEEAFLTARKAVNREKQHQE
jgi:hypothetical protein